MCVCVTRCTYLGRCRTRGAAEAGTPVTDGSAVREDDETPPWERSGRGCSPAMRPPAATGLRVPQRAWGNGSASSRSHWPCLIIGCSCWSFRAVCKVLPGLKVLLSLSVNSRINSAAASQPEDEVVPDEALDPEDSPLPS